MPFLLFFFLALEGVLVRLAAMEDAHVVDVHNVTWLDVQDNGVAGRIIVDAVESIDLSGSDRRERWVALHGAETRERATGALKDDLAVLLMQERTSKGRINAPVTERIEGPVVGKCVEHLRLLLD